MPYVIYTRTGSGAPEAVTCPLWRNAARQHLLDLRDEYAGDGYAVTGDKRGNWFVATKDGERRVECFIRQEE